MKDHEIDRILSEEEILPSSGFTPAVMDAVRREVATPLPIPFPWKRALPGLLAAGLTMALILVVVVLRPSGLVDAPSTSWAWVITIGNKMAELLANPEWRFVGIALLATFFSLVVPVRLALQRG